MKTKLTETQQTKLDAYKKGFNEALQIKTDNSPSPHCDNNTPERIKGYLEGQKNTLDMLQQHLGLIELGTHVDTIDETKKQSYYQGYEDGYTDAKRTILYEVLKNTSENHNLKPVQATILTELFKIVKPEDTEE